MKKFMVLAIACIIPPFIIFAQKTNQQAYGQRNFAGKGPAIGEVIGRVLNGKTNKGVGFATVEVLRAKDSSVVSGALSKDNGDFNIDQLPPGKFILHINFVGSSPVYHAFALTPNNLSLDLGNFKLTSSAVTLRGITINANPPAYTMSLDKKVF